MGYDENKKGEDRRDNDGGKEHVEKSERSGGENLHDYRKHGDFHKGKGSNKSESWITRPTTQETPTQPSANPDGDKGE